MVTLPANLSLRCDSNDTATNHTKNFASQISSFAEIEAHLSTLVISAIQLVFVPDIALNSVDADKVCFGLALLGFFLELNWPLSNWK